jgi:hypothetical protein
MKTKLGQDSNNQHVIAVIQNDEARCFFKNSSFHIVSMAFQNLCRDIARHGDSCVDFESLPLLVERINKSGISVFDVARKNNNSIKTINENGMQEQWKN